MNAVPSRLTKRLLEQRSLRYIVVGAVNTGFSFGLYCSLILWGLSVPMASLGSLVAGIVFSYITQGSLVFRSAGRGSLSLRSAMMYALNWAVLYGVYVGLVLVFMGWGLSAYTGGALATCCTTLLSYFSLRHWVFRVAAR